MIIPPENLEDLARKFGFGKYAKKGLIIPKPATFSITEDDKFYTINGVKINDKIKTVKWMKQLLDEGGRHLQHEWIEKYTKGSEAKLPSLPTYMATIIALYDNKDIEDYQQKRIIEQLREMFEEDFSPNKPNMMTSTCIIYHEQGPDEIRHDYKAYVNNEYDEYEVREEIPVINGWINQNSEFKQIIKALTGIDDTEKIEKAIQWTTTKKPILVTLDKKPDCNTVRTAELGDCGFGTYLAIDCYDIQKNYFYKPARGVIVTNVNETK